MTQKQPKKHKPLRISDIGKRLVFYRKAKDNEMPIVHDFYTCSGVALPTFLVKDEGILVKVSKINVWSNFSDKPKNRKYMSRQVQYEYTFLTKDGYEDSSNYYMNNGINGWGVVK